MRIILLALAAVCLHAATQPQPEKLDMPYLVVMASSEPDYESNARYAIACLPGVTDCGVPRKEVLHYLHFETEQAALDYLNSLDAPQKSSPSEDGSIWAGRLSVGIPAPKRLEFRAMYHIARVPVREKTDLEEVPQPPVKREKRSYAKGTK